MTWPVVVSFTLRQAFATVDLVYARFLPERSAAVAAIALWVPFQEVYIALWVGLSAGFTAALSHAFGRRDATRAAALRRAALRIQLAVACLLILAATVLWLTMGSWPIPAELRGAFAQYGTTLMFGLPLTGLWSVWPDSIVKAHHDTKATMLAGIWATVANVVLNTLFVFAFGWGLFGIALATVFSRVVALLYALGRARRHERRRLEERDWHHGPSLDARSPSGTILALGVPATVTFALAASESVLVNGFLTRQPDATEAIASYGVMNVLLKLALMPASATAIAVVPFVSRLAAAGRIETVRRDLLQAVLLALGFGLLFTLPAGVLFPGSVGRFFVPDSAAAALGSDLSRQLLVLLPFGALAVTPFLVVRPAFESVQRPRLGVLVALLRYALLAWPLIALGASLAPRLGIAVPLGMALGSMIAATIASSCTVALVFRELRRLAARLSDGARSRA
ncbi:MAG: MATE family efflux transporter [Planctomycetota bacterium]